MAKVKESKETKLTLEEYQQKYNKRTNEKVAKSFSFIFGALIGVLMGTALFFVVLRLFELHVIAGYIGIIAAGVIFITLYLVPVIKLSNMKSFITTTKDKQSARQAQKHNKALRREIADKMIDIAANTEGVIWYNSANVLKLAVARDTKNDQELKAVLTTIYQEDVKKSADKMIRKSAVRVGITTALSQSSLVDTLFMVTYELTLIKDIVFLYGYRPSEAQMAIIYKNVLRNALVAYGVSNVTSGVGKSLSSSLVTALEKVSHSGNFLASTIGSVAGSLAGTAVESSIQFAVNSTLTVIIGYQTQKYLIREYKLQEMLDNIEITLDDEAEEAKLIESIKDEVKATVNKKAKKVKQEVQPA